MLLVKEISGELLFSLFWKLFNLLCIYNLKKIQKNCFCFFEIFSLNYLKFYLIISIWARKFKMNKLSNILKSINLWNNKQKLNLLKIVYYGSKNFQIFILFCCIKIILVTAIWINKFCANSRQFLNFSIKSSSSKKYAARLLFRFIQLLRMSMFLDWIVFLHHK